MKIALLGDLHLGIKGFNEDFFNQQINYLADEFFPTIEQKNVDIIVQLGDLFDNRKISDNKFIIDIINHFEAFLFEYNIPFYILTGNHDIYYKNTREYSLLELLDKLPNFHWINKQTLFKWDKNILIVPWLLPNEEIKYLDKADYVFGHFEITDFFMVQGAKATYGIKGNLFKNIKKVFSGHYHIRQEKDNIIYVGTPYQLNFADAGNQKGFYILDTETDEIEFIANEYSQKYLVIWLGNDIYNSDNIDLKELDKNKLLQYNIKVIHRKDTKENTEFLYKLKKEGIDFIYIDEREFVDTADIDTKITNINEVLFNVLDNDLKPLVKELMSEIEIRS